MDSLSLRFPLQFFDRVPISTAVADILRLDVCAALFPPTLADKIANVAKGKCIIFHA
jgi:hypothetical protein